MEPELSAFIEADGCGVGSKDVEIDCFTTMPVTRC